MRILLLCFSLLFLPIVVNAAEQWTDVELSILKSLSLQSLSQLPKSPSNRYADDPRAQALGRQLFFDTQFSANQQLSCASCHQPDKFYTDGLPRGVGVNATVRNTPTVVGSAWLRWFYWDGRRDSLWSQALIPFEAPDEMASSRTDVVSAMVKQAGYRQQYEALFGNIPAIVLNNPLPKNAGPLGNKTTKNNWYRLPQATQGAVNQVYVNIGKAIAAYQRTLVYQPIRFDTYVAGLLNPKAGKSVSLSADEIAGLKLFIDAEKTQCLQCHNGPLMTNGSFHNVGSGNFAGQQLDFGRFLGLQAVLMDEFNCLGDYSDAEPQDCKTLRFLNKSHHVPLSGAFKTPSLRNLKQTAPYFHDGRFASIREVIGYYKQPPQDNGAHELKPLDLTEQELLQLVKFLETLSE